MQIYMKDKYFEQQIYFNNGNTKIYFISQIYLSKFDRSNMYQLFGLSYLTPL